MKELFDKESLQQNPGVDWDLLEKLQRINEELERLGWTTPKGGYDLVHPFDRPPFKKEEEASEFPYLRKPFGRFRN